MLFEEESWVPFKYIAGEIVVLLIIAGVVGAILG
jgi:hypothetical protein